MGYFRPEIEALSGYVPGEQPDSREVIKLNTNENPYPASPHVAAAVREVVGQADGNAPGINLQRYPNAMADPFRQRAAVVLGVPSDWIMCGNGSDDILTVVTRALVGRGEMLRLPYPSYVLYKTLAGIQGAKSQEIHFQSDWTLADDFCHAHEDLRLVFLPDFRLARSGRRWRPWRRRWTACRSCRNP